jgi:hypothetical protein
MKFEVSPEWLKKMSDIEDDFDMPDVWACSPELYKKLVDMNVITTDGNLIAHSIEDIGDEPNEN